LRSITVCPASVSVVVIALCPAIQNSVSRSWKAKQMVAAWALPALPTPMRAAVAGGEKLGPGHGVSP